MHCTTTLCNTSLHIRFCTYSIAHVLLSTERLSSHLYALLGMVARATGACNSATGAWRTNRSSTRLQTRDYSQRQQLLLLVPRIAPPLLLASNRLPSLGWPPWRCTEEPRGRPRARTAHSDPGSWGRGGPAKVPSSGQVIQPPNPMELPVCS